MRKLPSLNEMEHITSKEFGENMDAILDRVIDEEIAFIIEHNSKSYVLCPARWFELLELKHLELLIKNAVRLAVSVDDSDLTETVQRVKEMAPALSPECINSFLELIKSKGVKTGNNEWDELRQVLETTLPTTEKEKGEGTS